MLWEDQSTSAEAVFDRLKAFNSSAVDVAGAGDSLLITAAMGLATRAHPSEAMYLANVAAAIQVGRVGNIPLSIEEISSLVSKSAAQNPTLSCYEELRALSKTLALTERCLVPLH